MTQQLATLFAETAPAAAESGFFSGALDYVKGLMPASFDFQSLGAGGVAALLAAVWYFVRIVRAVVGILFSLCVIFLALHLAGYADIPTIWNTVSSWMGW